MLIRAESPESEDARLLMDELSDTLETITGNSGRSSFDPEDVKVHGSLFAIARGADGELLGCGAIRPLDIGIAEIKRMYSRNRGSGTGSEILAYLESKAVEFGYGSIRLETRRINREAVAFYSGKGYSIIPNYGRYEGNNEAICFEKLLGADEIDARGCSRLGKAVVVIDVQETFFTEEPPVFEGDRVVDNIDLILDTARAKGLPIIFIQHDGEPGDVLEPGTEGWQICRRLRPGVHETVVRKTTPDSFLDTELKGTLDALGVKELVIMGFQSDFCVDTTVRKAWSLGYNLTLVSDAHSTFDNPAITAEQVIGHENHVLTRFAKVLATGDVLGVL